METSLRGSGKTIRRMDMGCTSMRMGRGTKDSGRMIYRRGMESRRGRMGRSTRAIMGRVRNMEMVHTFGMMDPPMKVSG